MASRPPRVGTVPSPSPLATSVLPVSNGQHVTYTHNTQRNSRSAILSRPYAQWGPSAVTMYVMYCTVPSAFFHLVHPSTHPSIHKPAQGRKRTTEASMPISLPHVRTGLGNGVFLRHWLPLADRHFRHHRSHGGVPPRHGYDKAQHRLCVHQHSTSYPV